MDRLEAISQLSTIIGYLQHEYNLFHSPSLGANIKGLERLRETMRKEHEEETSKAALKAEETARRRSQGALHGWEIRRAKEKQA